MFTGLIQQIGDVVASEPEGPGRRMEIRQPAIAVNCQIGASIAINGCCLTAVAMTDKTVTFQAGEETLRRTNLGSLIVGSRVNLEPSLRVGDELGGHLVAGHVDGLATVDERIDSGEWAEFWFRCDPPLLRQMASKGSVTVDGISLTLVEVTSARFSVALIPHTLDATTLGGRKVGDLVNIETDILAKYVERQLATRAN